MLKVYRSAVVTIFSAIMFFATGIAGQTRSPLTLYRDTTGKAGQCPGPAWFIQNNDVARSASVVLSRTFEDGSSRHTSDYPITVPAGANLFLDCLHSMNGPSVTYSFQGVVGPSGGSTKPLTTGRPPLPPCDGYQHIGKLEGRGHQVKGSASIHIPFVVDSRLQEVSFQSSGGNAKSRFGPDEQHLPNGVCVVAGGDVFGYGWAVMDPRLDTAGNFQMYLFCSPGDDVLDKNRTCGVYVDVYAARARQETKSGFPTLSDIEQGTTFKIHINPQYPASCDLGSIAAGSEFLMKFNRTDGSWDGRGYFGGAYLDQSWGGGSSNGHGMIYRSDSPVIGGGGFSISDESVSRECATGTEKVGYISY